MPNKQIERKLRAAHGSCLRKPRARPSIPLNAGVRYMDIYYKRKQGSKGICHRLRHGSMKFSSKAKSMPLKSLHKGKNVMLFATDSIVSLSRAFGLRLLSNAKNA